MKKLLRSAALAATLLAGACASPPTAWDKPGATHADFTQDKYQCLKENQVPYYESNLYVGRYYGGGGASGGVRTNGPMAKACMESRGYRLVTVVRNGGEK